MLGFNLKDYDFDLPQNLIAQKPTKKREDSRLLIYDRKTDSIQHKKFADIVEYFGADDLLILNNSKVIPAKLVGLRITPRQSFEIVLVEEIADGGNFVDFSVIAKISKMKIGQIFEFPENITAEYIERIGELAIFRFNLGRENFYKFIDEQGKMPLPPYIKRTNDFDLCDREDRQRYQTVYAKTKGSIAAPTAGLHFTSAILSQLENNGSFVKYVTLHVGIGTFKPIKTESIKEHIMMPEKYEISDDVFEMLKNKARLITSVGTTSTRTIENFFRTNEKIGKTDLYIYPGHEFFIDRLITNFHVPRSTPLMLVAAFIADGLRKQGEDRYIENSTKILKKIYREAIDMEYRFYSYGDSMFVK